jgi:hypothetical protein
MNVQCIKCKGNLECGRSFCPIIAKSKARFKAYEQITEKEFEGSAPSVFVGHVGYPSVNVGILSPAKIDENAFLFDAPRHWGANSFGVDDVISLRSQLINSRFNTDIRKQTKILEIGKEIGMASKPVDVEISLKDRPQFKLNVHDTMAPMGPNASLLKAEITSNPHIDTRVEKIVDDTDLKANPAILTLYQKGFEENFLTKILSIGNIGMKKDRRLVPTRWAITAVDDNVGKEMIKQIKNYQETDYLAYFGSYLGNYYLVLMFPEVWSYELFETYLPNSGWNSSSEITFMTDYENYQGRKDYAENCGGGYYAARLPILEKLSEMKRQSSVLVLRFITGEYYCPLGVWVVREATRKSMMSKPLEFASKELMLIYARNLVKKKFGYDLDCILKKSLLLKNISQQKKLKFFFNPA